MNIVTHFIGGILSIVSVRALAQQGKDDWHYIIWCAAMWRHKYDDCCSSQNGR